MTDMEMYRTLIEQAHEHILKAQAFIAPLVRIFDTKKHIDINPYLEEIAKAAATINNISSEEAFEIIIKGIIKAPEQLQMMIDTVVSIQFDWPMPEEGWKRFVEDVERTNERLGLDLHINPPDHFDPLDSDIKNFDYGGQCEVVGGLIADTVAHWKHLEKDKETEMETKTTFIMAYNVDTIRLIRATLRGTTEPLVPYKVDPLEFCKKAHEVKDELIRHAMELLENTITPRFNSWISVEERMPTEDALYLIHAPSLDPDKPFIKTAWFDPNIVLGWQFIPKVWSDAVTHWMLLPEPPSTKS